MKLQPAKEIDFEELEKSRSYRLFKRAVKSDKTLYAYRFSLRAFLRYTNLSSYDEIVALPSDKIQEILENWTEDLADKGVKGVSIRVKLAPVELFLDMNKVVYYKRILHKLLPRDEGVLGGHEPFTSDEIKRMLESTKKLRTKAFVHFLASTGIRPGAIIDPILRRKHLTEMPEGCLSVKVYDNSQEGYYAFLTPEARRALYAYFDSRKLNGEILTDESPIFANERESQNNYFGYNSFKVLTTKLLKSAGIVRIKDGKRFNKAANYAFRKRFNTILKINNNVNSNIAEKLMAHRNGLDGNYLTPTRDECFAEFKKAIPDLTIDDSERQKITIREFQAERSELEKTKLEVQELKEFKERMIQVLEDMQSNPDKYLKKTD